jgi:hypothetical protein
MRLSTKIPVKVLLLAMVMSGLAVCVAALLQWWAVAITFLLVLQVSLAAIVLSAANLAYVAANRTRTADTKADRAVREIEKKMDRLGARMLASIERTRTEMLEAARNTPDIGR